MDKPLHIETKRFAELELRRGSQLVSLNADELALVLQRLVQEDQLCVVDSEGEVVWEGSAIVLRTDRDGRLYLELREPSQWPEQVLSLPEGYVDESGRVCNPFGC